MHPAHAPGSRSPDRHDPATASGIILAGGAGRRVQDRDKGLIDWQGRPLVAHAADRLRPLVRDLFISCNRNAARYREFADRVVADSRAGYQGPLAGLEAMRCLVSTPRLVVAPCDMPGLPRAAFGQLLASLSAARKDVVAVFLNGAGRDHYLCLALRREALDGITDYLDSGQRSVRGWLATLQTRVIPVDLTDAQLRNVNRVIPG